jgi:hypothetical protein
MINKIYAKVVQTPSLFISIKKNYKNSGQTTHVSKLYNPSGMCCPLILCRHEIMSEAKGPRRCQKIEEQKDGMTKE